ncbi:MAG: glutamyl-tRNA reductase [Deltaproteobacteria bacterium]|nr:glutamyl-tRNA reductase [Deltaproteobacteria bacterium]
MRFVVVGCNHRTAPLALRERLAVPKDRIPAALDELRALDALSEALLVSTCNRVEVYGIGESPHAAREGVQGFLAQVAGVDPAEIESALYHYEDNEALTHIFRVTASLDSMVVGEAQVAGQVKEAFTAATEAGLAGALLGRCMQRAFAVAKRVRTETGVARHPASVSSVAVDLADRVFEDLARVAVLVIGAGEMAELAVKHLKSRGASKLRVCNRSLERAKTLAMELGGEAVPFDGLAEALVWSDVVVSSTGSPQPIIHRPLLAEVMRKRKQRSLFLLDIAVPRDISSEAGQLANVYLFTVDDLAQIAEENLSARRTEAATAEQIVVFEALQFREWLRRQEAVPVIKQLRQRFVEVARQEAERTLRLLHLSGDEHQHALQGMADAIVNKLLHQPSVELKRFAAEPNGVDLAEATRRLFGLEGESAGERPANHAPELSERSETPALRKEGGTG